MSVKLAPRALADLESIRAYLVPRSPRGAERVRVAIAAAIERCSRDPRIGSRTDEPRLFRLPLRKYRFTIFYRVDPVGSDIEIVRIVRSARVRSLGKAPDDG